MKKFIKFHGIIAFIFLISFTSKENISTKKLKKYLKNTHQITIPETRHHFVFITGYSCPTTTERLTQFALKSTLRDSIHYIISGVTITALPVKNNTNRIIEKNNELFNYDLEIVMPTLVTTENYKILKSISITNNNIDEIFRLIK